MTDTVPDDPTAAPSQHARARTLADIQQLQARQGLPVPDAITIFRRTQGVQLHLASSSEVDVWARVLGLQQATSAELPSDNDTKSWWYGANGHWPGVPARWVYLCVVQQFPVLEEQGPRPGEAA